MNEYPQGIWNATEYFKHLTATNRLAKSEGFTFCSVSGLDGFEEALDHIQRSNAFICVSDIANGYTELILEKTKLENHCIYIDPRISFNEIDRYFFSGCACAYFQIAVDVYTDLRINPDEWNE